MVLAVTRRVQKRKIRKKKEENNEKKKKELVDNRFLRRILRIHN